jgi:hypothetical protein
MEIVKDDRFIEKTPKLILNNRIDYGIKSINRQQYHPFNIFFPKPIFEGSLPVYSLSKGSSDNALA